MRASYEHLVDQRFGKLVVVSISSERTRNYDQQARVRCDCGVEKLIRINNLLKENGTKSCGCLLTPSTNGLYKTPEYNAWNHMRGRCLRKTDDYYADYGGRGITICSEWLDSFENFLRDMGTRPSLAHSLDRIDNDGNYEKTNCVWATKIEQANNRSSNHLIVYDGRAQTIAQWAKETDIKYHTLKARIARGNWSIKESLER